MLNELTIRKRNTPDEMFQSYYADVFTVAKNKVLKVDEQVKPLLDQEFYYDAGDKIVFCILLDESKIFQKPVQVCIGSYLLNDLDEFLKVEEILYFQENFEFMPQIAIDNPERILKSGDTVPLVKLGLVVKGIINNGLLHLIWGNQLNARILNYFYFREKNKQVTIDLFNLKKRAKEDDFDFAIDTDDVLSLKSREAFKKWFHKKFNKTPDLLTAPIMEHYCQALSRTSKYYSR